MFQHQLSRAGSQMPLRIGLALFITLASVGITLALLAGPHLPTRAATSGISEISLPPSYPWGLAFDTNGNAWVAEPNCDPNPVCGGNITGNIIQVNRSAFTVQHTFVEPANYSSPLFLAIDANGNIWFSEPRSNAIGELVPNATGGSWNQWRVPTANAAPFDLAFDSRGNLWFTEILANKIGEFNPSTHLFTETATPSANSKPYGITGPDSTTGAMWLTENNPTVARVASFIPPASGALATSSVREYLTNSSGTGATPHLITFDRSGDIWWSEGPNGEIGRLIIAQAQNGTKSGVTEYRAPAPTCTAGCGTHISGIAVDSSGTVWADDSLSARVLSFSPSSAAFTQYVVGGSESSNAHPHDGLAVDSSSDVFFSEEFANKLGKITSSGPPASPPGSTSVPTPPAIKTPPGPVNTKWYFAEGRVGKGFREYLTIDNPANTACALSIQYQYAMDGSPTSSTRTVTPSVGPATRLTESVNYDLGIPDSAGTAASLSAVVNVTRGCNGVVAERPMYFSNYHGLSSGTDALGSTQLSTTFSFADVPTGAGATSFITILNPARLSTQVTANYYAGSHRVGQQTVTVGANSRGTLAPNTIGLPAHVAAVVSATQPVLVERPSYFMNVNAVSGAADIPGSTVASKSWFFAEGYAASNSQEYLTVANVGNTAAAVTITLKSRTGATQAYNMTVNPDSQLIWNVNGNNIFNGATPEVSAAVTSAGANIVVQREMYFQYHHTLLRGTLQANCITDVMGLPASALKSAYSFAEGYTNTGYNTWLTIQNTTNNAETIYVTLVNGYGKSLLQTVPVGANSRATLDITAVVQAGFNAGTNTTANAVSMTVQTLNNGGIFVAERPEYWNTNGLSSFATQGGSDVIGYAGG